MIGTGMLWRPAAADDIDAIVAIENAVHTLAHERPEIFAEKYRLFPQGCLMLMRGAACLGYGLSHPWRLGDAPAIDASLGALPTTPDCLFIHDVALRPEARGHGAGQDYVRRVAAVARARGLSRLALVSVYGTVPVWERCGFRVEPLPVGKLAPYGDTARYMTASGRRGATLRTLRSSRDTGYGRQTAEDDRRTGAAARQRSRIAADDTSRIGENR